ncbi:C40 family peptidase [Streptomyces sp. CBMA152]|uniref:C40 family peptidase n=1 Tax=Streptomyces sp. CBMA152 TaxID=1896312 RepID=UPI001661512C|nr:C40 family peptidase [Streptomyces sp. CBMA152]MBD0745504.1 glycoside hydrolase [Streptomyces sp. CBMA152]
MPSHRKPRTRIRTATPAVGITTAALASVGLLAQSASAAPGGPTPTVEEVQRKVDDLYRQAGTATEKYNRAKESADQQREKTDALLDQVARGTARLNDTRRVLGSYAAEQYRTGGMTSTMTLMLADDPQTFFDQNQLMKQLTGREEQALRTFETERAANAKQRAEASRSLAQLTASQEALRTGKRDVQAKLAAARTLLSTLTAQEKARLAALEKAKEDEARRKAEELAARQAAAKKAADAAAAARKPSSGSTGTGGGTGSTSPSAPSSSTKADKALAFARAQMGKPYVWGAVGPSSYDCSGLTQAAWKAAGVDLPRTTWDQVNVGTRVATADLRPGDLVFFYDDISHVGMYIGNGMMIHAPHPGAYVREESIYYMPIYGSVRPA